MRDPHPLAGRIARIVRGPLAGNDIVVADWWENVSGHSWRGEDRSPEALDYAERAVMDDVPLDDEVVCGTVGFMNRLVHASQLGKAKGWLN